MTVTTSASELMGATISRLRAGGCVFAEDEARLLIDAAGSAEELKDMTDRRVDGLPLEHILGWAEFCGLRIAVDPGVFVPRRRTEFLAQQAVAMAQLRRSVVEPGDTVVPVVVDLCCGTGAVGAAIAATCDIALYAVDIEPAAVACARRNLSAAGGRVFEGDLYDALPMALRGQVDVLVANTPYVPTDSIGLMPPEARLHEPRVALDGGGDGLDLHRRLAATARSWLSPRGRLLVETSPHQARATADIVAGSGLVRTIVTSDALDATVVIGRHPGESESA